MRFSRLFAACLWLAGVPAVLAQEPVGPPFQVNTHTTSDQLRPAVAADATGGRFVVVWQSFMQDGSAYGLIGRRYDASAGVAGPELLVNQGTFDAQRDASVALQPDGGFVVVWTRGWNQATRDLRGRRFDAAGAAGAEFAVNTYGTLAQQDGSVAVDAAGNFVVSWQSDLQDGSGWGVFAQRYDARGARLGAEFRVNVRTAGDQLAPAIAVDAAGGFVVVWQSHGQDGDGGGIIARRYDSAGTALGLELQVNEYTTGTQRRPVVAPAAGGFVIAWESEEQDGNNRGVFGRRFDLGGAPLGAEFQVNTYTTSLQGSPAIAGDASGAFVVVWDSWNQDGSSYGVFGQRFDASGVAVGGEFRANTITAGIQRQPAVGAAANGNFVVAWTGFDTDYEGVFARRYGDLIHRDGFEGGDLSRWSRVTGDGAAAVDPSAALADTALGMKVVADEAAPAYVQDDSPNGERRYRARFYFDPHGFDPGESQSRFRARIFIAFSENPVRRLIVIAVKRQAGAYSLMARVRRDDGSRADTGFVGIADAPQWIEVDWLGSTSEDATDGEFRLWLGGVPVATLNSLDLHAGGVDFVRLGALAVKPGATGTPYFDEFESRRALAIGAVAVE